MGYVEKAEVAEVVEVAEMCKTWRKMPTDFRPLPPPFTDFGYLRHLRYLRNLRVLHIPGKMCGFHGP